MFDALAERLTAVFQRLRGKGTLTESDVSEGLREIRLALLEADVHYKVAKELIEKIRVRAVGAEVLESLTPGQQLLKIVRDELAESMGGERTALRLDRRPSVVLLVGLQGSGKTTTAAKLASLLRHEGRKPVLVAADVYRPAAIDQLEKLGRDLDIPVVSRTDPNPVKIAAGAVGWARQHLRDVVLIDTAGRLQIDDEMMQEIADIVAATSPVEKLLVADAMTGQEAVAVATAFNDRVALTGVILSKTDGDARGGAALSIRHAVGRPIVYVGTGEKTDGLEPFHPQRMAERILGMGDVLTLIEQAEEKMDVAKAEQFVKNLQKNRFTLQDFLEQLEEVRKLGPLSQILDRLPGAAKLKGSVTDESEADLKRTLAILRSMTLEERREPSIIGGGRKKRIARGSGTKVRDVNAVLTRYAEAKRALKWVGGRRGKGRFPPDMLGAS